MIANAISWLITNYLLAIGIYVAGGALYALLKWVIMIIKLRNRVIDIGEVQIAQYRRGAPGYSDKPDSFIVQLIRDKETRYVFGTGTYPPKASENKGNLSMWAILWPFNLIYTLFADVAKGAWEFLYNRFGSALNAIATSILPH